MKTWLVLYKKELFSFWRSSKWLWLPIVFTFLSVSQPISLYVSVNSRPPSINLSSMA